MNEIDFGRGEKSIDQKQFEGRRVEECCNVSEMLGNSIGAHIINTLNKCRIVSSIATDGGVTGF
jgi:hypothetical protein